MIIRIAIFVAGLLIASQSFAAAIYRASADEVSAATLISRFRAEHGLGRVTPDGKLSTIATAQAAAMASIGVMAHDVAGNFGSRVEKAGLGGAIAAENIGAGYPTISDAIEGWQRSAGHRQNLLLPGVSRIGLARVRAQGKAYSTYWALILAGPEPSAARPSGSIWGSALPAGIGFFVGR